MHFPSQSLSFASSRISIWWLLASIPIFNPLDGRGLETSTTSPSPSSTSTSSSAPSTQIVRSAASMNNDIIWDAASAMSAQESEQCPTPTGSEVSERGALPRSVTARIHQRSEHHPREGATFVIRSHDARRMIIELRAGELHATSDEKCGAGIFWHCVKRHGWYGFRNSVSGTFMGHTGGNPGHSTVQKPFWARVGHHQADEYFMAERAEEGGYFLLVKNGDALWQMTITEDGRLVAVEEGGIAWDFIEIQDFEISLNLGVVSVHH